MSNITLRLEQLAGYALAIACLLAPVASVFAPKIMTFFVPVAAGLALPLYRPKVKREHIVMLLLVSGLVIAGLLQSPVYDRAFRFVTSAVGLIFSGLVLVHVSQRLPLHLLKRIASALTIGLVLALIALYIERKFGQPLATFFANQLNEETPPFHFIDRAIVITSLLFWVWVAMQRQVWWLVFAAMGLLFCHMATYASSQASVAGLAFGLLVYAVANIFPRLTYRLVRIGAVVVIMTMPFIICLLSIYFADGQEIWYQANAMTRLGIWSTTASHVLSQPWTGYGLQSAYVLVGSQLNFHPHNGILQIWIEFGLVGAVLAVAAVLLLLEKAKGRPAFQAAFSAWLMVFCVSYDYWQSWWIATMALLIALLGIAMRLRPLPAPALPNP